MENALPYRIPGPAGGLPSQPPTTSSQPLKPVLDLFRTPPWRQMLTHLNKKIPSSIALLRRNALSHDYAKLRSLPVLIDSLVYVGKDASVLLRDPTGHVRGTIHAEVFAQRKGVLERGVVLLLNGVSALAYLEESRGFRGGEETVHLSVQACHVSEVFKGDTVSKNPESFSPPLDDYTPAARLPKPVVPPPSARLPLRERNAGRPTSRGYQSSPRGGRGGRLYQPSQPHPQRRSPQETYRPQHQQQNYQQHQQQRYQQQQRQTYPQQPSPQERAPCPAQPPSSAPHTRPFHPPSMTPNFRRPGMQPPQKRAAVRSAASSSMQLSRSVKTLTDDQLDSLLGEVDVDALIAASGKSSSITPPTEPNAPAPKVSLSTPGSSGQGVRRDVQLSSGDKMTHDAAALTKDSPAVSDGNTRSGSTSTNPEPRATGQAKRTISAVDEAMIDSLFDGLDASDFT